MAASASHPAKLVGQTLGHYHIAELIGAGAFGEVYRARDENLQREVAIKVLPTGTLTNADARNRFHNEALALSKAVHPSIATVYEFNTQADLDYLVTEYVPGMTLETRLASGPLPEAEVLELGTQFADGLRAAHAHGIVHRDLKPANLRVTPDGALKILDFGLALQCKPAGEASTLDLAESEGLTGTLAYMAPEQVQGAAVDARTDLYSAGAVLYEMSTGRRPFPVRHAAAVIAAILHDSPLPPGRCNPAVSNELEHVILRCMAKNPAHRYQSAADLLADLRRVQTTGAVAQRSLAVLYFEDLSGQSSDEYFRDGITEDITTELSKIADLRTFSRSAVLPFRGKPVTPSYVGQQLNASYVVEGSLRRERDTLRITAKLVETKTGHTLWAERYDRKLEDVFAVQDEIAHSVAGALRLVLSDKEKQAIRKIPTADVRAYDFYLRGRHFFHQFRRRGLDFARDMFGHAIAIDPNYARAYAGIADCSAFLYMYWDSSPANLEQADSASERALELDPDLAEAHASRGLTASLKRDYDLADREFATAIRLNPKLFEPYYFSARNLYSRGQLEEAVGWFEKASLVLPEDYQSPMLMASALNGLNRAAEAQAAYRRGLAAAEKHLEVHPGDARALYFGANALTQLRDKERAMQWAERALALEGEAEPMVLYNVACVYALLGEADRAIDCLAKSVTQGWAQREWMAHDPDLAAVRDHPRFQALLQTP